MKRIDTCLDVGHLQFFHLGYERIFALIFRVSPSINAIIGNLGKREILLEFRRGLDIVRIERAISASLESPWSNHFNL